MLLNRIYSSRELLYNISQATRRGKNLNERTIRNTYILSFDNTENCQVLSDVSTKKFDIFNYCSKYYSFLVEASDGT